MTTWKSLVAVLSGHILALLAQAHVVKGSCSSSLDFLFLVRKHITAESTLFGDLKSFVFFTVLSSMVGLLHAACAEVVLTATASETVATHMNGRCRRHHRPCVVLGVVVDLPLDFFSHFATRGAFYDILVLGNQRVYLLFFNFFDFFLVKIIFHLELLNTLCALRTCQNFILGEGNLGKLLEAVKMH